MTTSREEADDAVAAHLRAEFGPGEVRVGRLCQACGSSEHGRPWARYLGAVPVPVSLSRAAPHLVTAVWTGGVGHRRVAIGVDVEEVVRVEERLRAEDLLAADEVETLDRPGWDLARVWVSKEAIAKAEGTGLNRPLPEIGFVDRDVFALQAPHGFRAALSAGRF